MIRRLLGETDLADFIREEPATVLAFDEGNRSYTVRWRGAQVGGLWSVNHVRHGVGAEVKILIRGAIPLMLIP